MEIVFLGTGGGRVNLIKQIRATGGFRINCQSANIHVDPGPGALLQSLKFRQDPIHLDAIIVTHDHTDHIGDARVLIEAMSGFALKRNGMLIGSKSVLNGKDGVDRGIGLWHQNLASSVYEVVFNERKRIDTKKGSFEIEPFRMKHNDDSTFGFKLRADGKTLGYISDTEFQPNLGEDFSGCDLLIINCIKPQGDKYDGHLTIADVIEIVKKARPKACVITHFGLKMLNAGPATEAQRIEDATGVKTMAAKDGQRIVA